MIELDTIYNEDCLTGMQRIPDGSVDCIICDLPYGTIKGTALNWRRPDDDKCLWDEVIPSDKLFEQYERVLRRGGMCLLFSQEPYTSHLRTFNAKNMYFCYPCYWKKEHAGNILLSKKAPVNYIEDINVFAKRNPTYDFDGIHPLRPYFAKVLEFIGKPKKQIIDEIGQGADHCFRCNTTQFTLCTAETYGALIERYGIDKMQGFKSYEELQGENSEFFIEKKDLRTFNLPEGKKSLSNVFEFPKEFKNVHPTQKPVALIKRLVEVYSNPGDTILDNCMGSGTTAIACMRTNRHYLGFELNRDYYDIALRRIKLEQQQQTLF